MPARAPGSGGLEGPAAAMAAAGRSCRQLGLAGLGPLLRALQRQTHNGTVPPTWLHGRTQRGNPLAPGCWTQSTAAASAPVLPAASPPLPTPSIPGTEVAGPGPELEVSLSQLGLANYTPVGLIQTMLECLHVHLGLPWWGAIVAGTVVARCLIFPLCVRGQREAVKISNHSPQISRFAELIGEAKRSGDQLQINQAYSDLMMYRKANDIDPLRSFLVPLIQAPIFISFFIALRQMADFPVPSMQSGGLAWFPDLTFADPFYILPLAVTGSMMLVLELGTESRVDISSLKMKTVFRLIPLAILPFTISFPTAVLIYWLTSNVFTLVQVGLLRIPAVCTQLGIPKQVKHKPKLVPKNEGLYKSPKTGAQHQTFTHNPLKPQDSQPGSNTPHQMPKEPLAGPIGLNTLPSASKEDEDPPRGTPELPPCTPSTRLRGAGEVRAGPWQ